MPCRTPDELAAALQALAGPSRDKTAARFFVDGFSGALASQGIDREFGLIRIHSQQKDMISLSGRIDILTRPGTTRSVAARSLFQDESFNSRNPLLRVHLSVSPISVRQYVEISAALVKRSVYFLDFERRGLTTTSWLKPPSGRKFNPLDWALAL